MKKIIPIVLAAALLLSLGACGKKETAPVETASPAETAAASAPAESAASTAEPISTAEVVAPGTEDGGGISARFLELGEDVPADYTFLVDDNAPETLFIVAGTLQDVQFVQVVMNDDGSLTTGDVLWNGGTLADGATVKLIAYIPDAAPNVALRYTAAGVTRTLAVSQSGRDGSLLLIEL